MTGYSLERLAMGYLRDRDVDAANLRRVSLLREARGSQRGPRPFMRLLGWWIRLTALLLRYPVNPVRAAAKMSAIGIPATLLAGRNLTRGDGDV